MSISAKNLIEIQKKQNKKRRFKTLLFTLIFLFVTYRGLFSILLIAADIKITAHRGSTVLSPENSISSVVEALALNVDYIEVDAQLTKDGKVILLHDRTFKRTAGVTSKPKDLTYEEMQNINIGYYKPSAFETPVPLLEDVIRLCRYSCGLNIELKDYGNNDGLPAKVVQLLEDYDYIDGCYITSTSSKFLKEVRNLNPNIKIGLITSSTMLTTYINNSFVDFYSVNYLSLSPSITLYIRSSKKKIHAWTPSSKITVETAIRMGANNIITDDISTTKFTIISMTKELIEKGSN